MSLISASENFVNCWTGHLFALCSTCLGSTVWDRGTFATRGRDLMETSQRNVFWLNMVSCVKVDSCYLQQKTGFLRFNKNPQVSSDRNVVEDKIMAREISNV